MRARRRSRCCTIVDATRSKLRAKSRIWVAGSSRPLRNLSRKRLQCDEIWSFVGGKDKNLPSEKKEAGLGSVWTTIHLFFEKDVAELLGIPPEWTQAAMLPVAYYTGDDFKPGARLPAEQMTHWDSWGTRS